MPTAAPDKKKYTYLGIAAIVLIFGIFAAHEITKKLEEKTVVNNTRMSANTAQKPVGYITTGAQKRKAPPFSFINQDSILISNKNYLGKVYIVDFFFTTCPTICPIMTQNLVELQNTFKEHKNFGIASFTINPKYDTPAILKKYTKHYGITHTNWHLLTGDQHAIYKLAQEGFYITANAAEDAPGGFQHSGMFALVDKKGYLRSRSDPYGNPLIYYRGTITEKQGINNKGETQQITLLKEDIKKLLAE